MGLSSKVAVMFGFTASLAWAQHLRFICHESTKPFRKAVLAILSAFRREDRRRSYWLRMKNHFERSLVRCWRRTDMRFWRPGEVKKLLKLPGFMALTSICY